MIIQIDDILLIPQVVKTVKKLLTIPEQKFEDMIIDGMTMKNSLILLDRKDEQVRGFLLATIEEMEAEEVVFIQITYIRPDAPKIGDELLARVNKWAIAHNIKDIYMMTPRNVKGFEKKYGFKFYCHVLKRRVKNETHN